MNDLEGCPFCGAIPKYSESLINFYCPNCGLEQPDSYSNKKAAIKNWNTRINYPSQNPVCTHTWIKANADGGNAYCDKCGVPYLTKTSEDK